MINNYASIEKLLLVWQSEFRKQKDYRTLTDYCYLLGSKNEVNRKFVNRLIDEGVLVDNNHNVFIRGNWCKTYIVDEEKFINFFFSFDMTKQIYGLIRSRVRDLHPELIDSETAEELEEIMK